MYKIYKNKIFKTKIGKLIKFVDKDSKFLKKFGEIYFNNIKISKKKKRLDIAQKVSMYHFSDKWKYSIHPKKK